MASALKVVSSFSVECIIMFIIAALMSCKPLCPALGFPSCNCTNSLDHGYELQCPAFTMRVSNVTVDIKCVTNDVGDFSMLNGMRIGELDMLNIHLCPLKWLSSSQLIQKMGVSKLRLLTIMYTAEQSESTETVSRGLFHGLSNVRGLRLYTTDVTHLSDDVFTDLPDLEDIVLWHNHVSLPKAIFYSTPNLVTLRLVTSHLIYLQPGIFKNLTSLKKLDLSGNIRNLSRSVLASVHNLESLKIEKNRNIDFSPHFLIHLFYLRKIQLYEIENLSLPQKLVINSNILEFSLQYCYLTTLPSRLLAGLNKLRKVILENCNISALPEDLLRGSRSIETISLSNNRLTTLPKRLFIHCDFVVYLDISFNLITHLPDKMLSGKDFLRTLKLNDNRLTVITNHFLDNHPRLGHLYLANNRLTHIEEFAFFGLTNLEVIDLSNNNLTFEDIYGNSISPFFQCRRLLYIQLANNSLSKLLLGWRKFELLRLLNVSNNKIYQIKAEDFCFNSTNNIIVDVSHNNISEIDMFGEERNYTYGFKSKKLNVPVKRYLIEGNPVNCGCQNYSFLQYHGDKINAEIDILMEAKPGVLKCAESEAGELEEKIPLKHFNCLLKKNDSMNCPQECKCSFRFSDKLLVVDCYQRNLTTTPKALPGMELFNYTELNLSGNRIKLVKPPLGPGYDKVIKFIFSGNEIYEINLTAFSHELQVLMLDGNNLTQFNETSIEFLKNATDLTHLTLDRNPWKCDCTTKDFVTVMQSFYISKKIIELDNATCENGTVIYNISTTELCFVNSKIAATFSSGTLLFGVIFGFLFGILFALYYKFQKEIKIWLYAHHCCLWFINEEELDQNKLYDAFISYSQRDEDFVMDHLVPRLENGSIKYKLCVHLRDWIPGEFVPAQIARSVEESRRTIIVLSPNFLRSVWGKMEFCAAHRQAFNEGRVRLIIILYKDIGPINKLDSELRAYLTMNTYVKWGDPWFWDKLCYALPRSSGRCKRLPSKVKSNRKLYLTDIPDLTNES